MIFTLILKSGPKPSPSVGEVFLKSAAMYSFFLSTTGHSNMRVDKWGD